MRAVRYFEEFLAQGIAKKQAPDYSRAGFLANESEKSFAFLKTIISDYGITDDNANSVVRLCYDIFMEIMRAVMLKNGFNSSGQGAHEAEVSYMRNIGFGDSDIIFADQMRYFRNGIVYYGKVLDAEYAKKVYGFLEKVYPKLKKTADSKLNTAGK
ncbi:MAG: hypothetical protein HY365_02640 [Candidatus Aenigmarchaeota archaeon]|nr:hypothetical protein [Candidatus Aenigmarchaeota archaeon]